VKRRVRVRMNGHSVKRGCWLAVGGLLLRSGLLAQGNAPVGNTYPMVPIDGTQLRTITSAIVHQDYLLKIRLPQGYERTDKRYPVLFLLDGDHAFAMATDVVQYLEYGGVPDLIIVSPAYGSKDGPSGGGTNMRDRDLRFPGPTAPPAAGGDKYLRFLKEELIPYVDSTFRTTPTDRTLWGYSLGASFGLHALFHEPALFTRYVIVDGFSDDIPELESAFAGQHSDLPIRLYLASAVPEADLFRFSRTLEGRNYRGLQLTYADLCGVSHFAVGAEGLARGLRAVFSKRSVYETLLGTIRVKGLPATLAQYKSLKNNHPMEYDFSESELDDLGLALIKMDRLRDAVAILELNAQTYPSSSDAHYALANAYRRHGDTELAVKAYRRSLELNPKNTRAAQWLERLGAARQ
jgi:pimeloyl-ACP methyl ester carboxylesterase